SVLTVDLFHYYPDVPRTSPAPRVASEFLRRLRRGRGASRRARFARCQIGRAFRRLSAVLALKDSASRPADGGCPAWDSRSIARRPAQNRRTPGEPARGEAWTCLLLAVSNLEANSVEGFQSNRFVT